MGGLTGAFVRSQADVRTSLSEELTDAITRLGLPVLDGFTMRVGYARSMSEGQNVLDGYNRTAADEVQALLSSVGQALSQVQARHPVLTSHAQLLRHCYRFCHPIRARCRIQHLRKHTRSPKTRRLHPRSRLVRMDAIR